MSDSSAAPSGVAGSAPADQAYVRVRGGAVTWRGHAILIPAAPGSGTSTLVDALVRRGAQPCADPWTTLDEHGRIVGSARGGHAPLPVALVVATTYRPESRWEPVVITGARALLSVVGNAETLHDAPARVLRVSAALGSGLVAVESPRPEADEVAPAILEFADAILAGHLPRFTSVRRPGAPRPAARATIDAPPAGARVHRAVYLRVENFLSDEEHRQMLDFAREREPDFSASGLYEDDTKERFDDDVRRSRSLYQIDEGVWPLFERRLTALLPSVRRELGLPWFRLSSIERQLHVHRHGDFFGRHYDNGTGNVSARRVSAVYYFHEHPRRFDGGALYLYDEIDVNGRREVGPSCVALEPLDNSIVFFPSGTTHEVEPVRMHDGDFRASRFTVTFWFREDEAWQRPEVPAAVTG